MPAALTVKKSCDLLETPSEIDFMDDSFIDHDDDLLIHSVDNEEIEDDTESVLNDENILKNKEDIEQNVNNQEINENIVNNQENTNKVNTTDTKQNIIKANDVVETTEGTGEFFFILVTDLVKPMSLNVFFFFALERNISSFSLSGITRP